MNKQEKMLKSIAMGFGILAVTFLLGYYIFQVMPAIDAVRMYRIEQEQGMLPNY